jgi:hypothetical protein
MDFVLHRKQYVQVGGNCSSILTTHAGTPQGTLAGPNNFKLLINDLTFDQEYIKYVDDTTVLSVSTNPQDSSLQVSADHLVEWTQCNSMVVNEQKTKEMLIYFGTKVDPTTIQKIRINDKDTERIKTFKLLGVIISNDLSWDAHVDYILGKVAKRFYFLIQLVHAGVRDSDMITIFCSIVRSVLEYACPVWHPGLTKSQSKKLERVQKRFLKLLFPSVDYETALQKANLDRLDCRRENLTKNTFQELKQEGHILHTLLPAERQSLKKLRHQYPYSIPVVKKTRFGRDIIPFCISKRY